MTVYFAATLFVALLLWSLHKTKLAERAAGAPALLIALGAIGALAYRIIGGPAAPAEFTAGLADALLAALAFAAAAQFRVSKLAAACPASFRLTIGGAPIFLFVCFLAAFILAPQLTLGGALILSGALMLNGAAFDRKAVARAPAPRLIKSAVRLESAAILALGLPVVVLLEGFATMPGAGQPAAAPIYEASLSTLIGFALGGGMGLLAAGLSARWRLGRSQAHFAFAAGAAAFLSAPLLGGHAVVAAAAAGLIWGEQTDAVIVTRVRLRRATENWAGPAAYFLFGVVFAPRFLQADLLALIFAISVVTVIRVLPRLAALRRSGLAKESQGFLAWFGGAPGAASALYLVSLLDTQTIASLDGVLTIGAFTVACGVVAARLTSRPLISQLLKETALAKRRAMFA